MNRTDPGGQPASERTSAGRGAGVAALRKVVELDFDPDQATYFAGRETILASRDRGMPWWRDPVFAFMHRNAVAASRYFRIPLDQLMEVGGPVRI